MGAGAEPQVGQGGIDIGGSAGQHDAVGAAAGDGCPAERQAGVVVDDPAVGDVVLTPDFEQAWYGRMAEISSGRTDREELAALVESVLDSAAYRYGDWFDLPMPLYLVHDDSTHDTFRVAVRDGRVEVHVLPETEPEGVRALHDRLVEASGEAFEWTVERRIEEP